MMNFQATKCMSLYLTRGSTPVFSVRPWENPSLDSNYLKQSFRESMFRWDYSFSSSSLLVDSLETWRYLMREEDGGGFADYVSPGLQDCR
jgi:hypothetical protein